MVKTVNLPTPTTLLFMNIKKDKTFLTSSSVQQPKTQLNRWMDLMMINYTI